MKKLAAFAAVAALAALPATAGAHQRAKVYKASFQLVGADGSYTRDSFGKAQLVDGKRNDQLSVHVRHLGAKATYVYRLQSAAKACTAGAAGGTDVPGWTYRRGGVLKTNRHGVANSFARSHTFTVDRTVEYFVGVFSTTASGAPDQLVACAKLTSKHKAKKKPHGKKGHGHKGSGNGHKDKSKGHKGGSKGHKDESKGHKDKGNGNKGSGDKPSGSGHSGSDKPSGSSHSGSGDDNDGSGGQRDSGHANGHGQGNAGGNGRGHGKGHTKKHA